MNRKKPVFSMIVYILCFAVIAGGAGYAFVDETTVSAAENRTLAKQPELTAETWLSGSFATEMDGFITDHIFKRAEAVEIAKRAEGLLEREMEIKVISQNVDIGVDVEPETPSGGGQPEDIPGRAAPAEELEQEEYVVLPDRIVPVYADDESARQRYSDTVDALFDSIPDRLNKYLLLVPGRIAFEEPDIASLSGDQQAAIGMVYDDMGGDIITVDAYANLAAHQDEALYFRLDHHWTQLGAYYGAEAFFDAAGVPYIPIGEYDEINADPFLGYLYARDPQESMREHPDDLTLYLYGGESPDETVYLTQDGETTVTEGKVLDGEREGYYTFVASTFSYAVAEGRAEDGRSVLVVGDSYANAMMPWLADNFKTAILIDPRFYTGGADGVAALLTEYAVTDFLIVDYTSVLSAPYFASQMELLCQ